MRFRYESFYLTVILEREVPIWPETGHILAPHSSARPLWEKPYKTTTGARFNTEGTQR